MALTLGLGLIAPASPHEGLDEQIGRLTAQIAREPRDARLYLRRGELHRLHRAWNAASADYAQAARLAPGLAEVRLARARLALDGGRPGAALAEVDAFLAAHPDAPAGLSCRAETLTRLGRTRAAVEAWTALIRVADAPSPEHYLARAEAQSGLGRPEEALAGLEEGMVRLGRVGTLDDAALSVEAKTGRYEAALARLERLVASSPRPEGWLARRGEVLEAAGRGAEARQAYLQALTAIASLPEQTRATGAVRRMEARLRSRLPADVAPPIAEGR